MGRIARMGIPPADLRAAETRSASFQGCSDTEQNNISGFKGQGAKTYIYRTAYTNGPTVGYLKGLLLAFEVSQCRDNHGRETSDDGGYSGPGITGNSKVDTSKNTACAEGECKHLPNNRNY